MLTVSLSALLFALPLLWTTTLAHGPCSGGVYATLWRATNTCYDIYLDNTVTKLKRRQRSVSGPEILEIYADFCRKQDKIKEDLLRTIQNKECLSGSENLLEQWFANSTTVCTGNVVNDLFKIKLRDLPRLSLVKNESQCYDKAFRSFLDCIQPIPDADNVPFLTVTRTMLEHLPCAIETLEQVCSHDEAVLYGIITEAWILCPPALGVDALSALLNM